MSVADEAKAAAEAEFPAPWDGRTGMRIPFAHGYQRGYEAGFRAAWEISGDGHNGEYPDEGVPWEQSVGHEEYLRRRAQS